MFRAAWRRGSAPPGVPLLRLNYYIVNHLWMVVPVVGALGYAWTMSPSDDDLKNTLEEKYGNVAAKARALDAKRKAQGYTAVLRGASSDVARAGAGAGAGGGGVSGVAGSKGELDALLREGVGGTSRTTALGGALRDLDDKQRGRPTEAERAAAAAAEAAAADAAGGGGGGGGGDGDGGEGKKKRRRKRKAKKVKVSLNPGSGSDSDDGGGSSSSDGEA